MQTDNQLPNILEYMNYRNFLRDFYSKKKELKSEYSYRTFTRMGELSSPSHLKMVMDGKRSLTNKTIPKYIKALGLKKKKEAQFFELLVKYNQEKVHQTKIDLFKQIMAEKKKKGLSPIEEEQFAFLSQWHCVAIYVLIDLPNFSEDPEWIVSRLKKKVSKKNVSKALQTLIDLNLIELDDNGQWVQTKGALSTPDDLKSIAIQSYHRDMISLAEQSLLEDDPRVREFNGVTFPISKELLPEMKEKIRQFRKELNELASNNPACDEVYQINIQLFPLTEVQND